MPGWGAGGRDLGAGARERLGKGRAGTQPCVLPQPHAGDQGPGKSALTCVLGASRHPRTPQAPPG